MSTFWTLKASTTGEYKEKGSRFLAFAFPVKDEVAVKLHLDALRKTYFDARHHCYAYVLGMKTQRIRSNDDGEPNHSAGDPILGQIRSHGLTDCLVVVVRYFGGTKLGVGGLISAYRTAADDALSKAERLEIFPESGFSIIFDYVHTGEVERVLTELPVVVDERLFTDACHLRGRIRESLIAQLDEKMTPLHFVQFRWDQEM